MITYVVFFSVQLHAFEITPSNSKNSSSFELEATPKLGHTSTS